jgi:protoheme IX farnesyltransferase
MYYQLTKPGIIYGNLFSAAGGFLFASGRVTNIPLGLAALSGTGFTIASGCVLNNYIDRTIDAQMDRTKQRALVQGKLQPTHALIYAAILCILGFGILTAFTNLLTVYIGLAGLYGYVVAYGYAKRKGAIGTIVGSFSGATPMLAGYTAVTGRLDLAGGLIFLAMALWQMPHFYAIATFRLKDYQSAGIPVLPAVRGLQRTKVSIMGYIVAYAAVVSLLTITGYTSYIFLVIMLGLNLTWLWKGSKGFGASIQQQSAKDAEKQSIAWARGMFGFSLVVLLSFSILLSVDNLL